MIKLSLIWLLATCLIYSACSKDIDNSLDDSAGSLVTVRRSDGSISGPYFIKPLSHPVEKYAVETQNGLASTIEPQSQTDSDLIIIKRQDGSISGPYNVKSPSSANNDEKNVNTPTEKETEMGTTYASVLNDQNMMYYTQHDNLKNKDITESQIDTSETEQKDQIILNLTPNGDQSLISSKSVEYTDPPMHLTTTFNQSKIDITAAAKDLLEATTLTDYLPKEPNPQHDRMIDQNETLSYRTDLINEEKPLDPIDDELKPDTDTRIPESPTECHTQCSEKLDSMSLKFQPIGPLLLESESLTLECNIPISNTAPADMVWLFWAIDPPRSQCALTRHDSLNTSCSRFPSVQLETDSNILDGVYKEVLTLRELTSRDTGFYICWVKLLCCENTSIHTNRLIQTDYPIIIAENGDYTTELVILGTLTIILTAILCFGSYIERRRRPRRHTVIVPETETRKTVLHAPLLNDSSSDSFDSDEERDKV